MSPWGGLGGDPPGHGPGHGRNAGGRRQKTAGHGIISADAFPGGTDGPKMVHKMVQEGLESPKDRPKTPKMGPRWPKRPPRHPKRPPRSHPREPHKAKFVHFT